MTKNKLKSFPAMKLQELRILTLSENEIDSMDDLADGIFPNLEELYLDINKLVRLSPLKLKRLNILNFEKNKVEMVGILEDFETP